MKRIVFLVAALMLTADAADAFEDFSLQGDNNTLTSSGLSAVIAASSFGVSLNAPSTAIQGNRIDNAFNGVTGVVGVNQNTGANAVVQQALTVNIGTLNLAGAPVTGR